MRIVKRALSKLTNDAILELDEVRPKRPRIEAEQKMAVVNKKKYHCEKAIISDFHVSSR